ncbi:myeloid leukemia factor isoform X2 [Ptiloglossa arizonensis]|uniref:myeloid leukemia factor isoform X2 n=1 Tax=Ptiloglossa arizonensis TaxID=3350558 RepID=UPI003FA1147E
MSLFGSLDDGSGDFDDDFIFGSLQSMRHMNMMNSLFDGPFGLMGQNAITNDAHRCRNHQDDLQIMPFGFPPMPSFNMGRLFADFDNQMFLAPNGNCHSFTSSSVMSMASGPDGRPQVYQETMSTTTAPGGVTETKKTVCDSRTGVKKLAIGHHIGERAHILEREHNVRSGEQEERQEYINLDEEEAESFNNEWESRTRHAVGAIGNSRYGAHGHRSRPDHRQLALPDASGSSDTSGRIKPVAAKPTATPTATVTASSANAIGNRKREHTPDAKVYKKRHAVSDSNI